MRKTTDTVWQRRGISWIWDAEALALVAQAGDVWSLRQLLQTVGRWPDDLPSNQGSTLVVAGLEGSLDLLRPADAEVWLETAIKPAILSFQDAYDQAALVFWLPGGAGRLTTHPATDAVAWRCAAPSSSESVDLGRIL